MCEGFERLDEMEKHFPLCDTFYSKTRSFTPTETENTKHVNLVRSGMTAEQVVAKMRLSKPPTAGVQIYQNLQKI